LLQLDVSMSRGPFDRAERGDEATGKADPADREILDRSLGLRAIERVHRNSHLSQRVLLDSIFGAHEISWVLVVGLRCSVPLGDSRRPAYEGGAGVTIEW